MKSTAGRLTCPHCGKEYSTEEAYRLYESIKEEKQFREEEEIREKSISYVNSTYESCGKNTKEPNDTANKSLVYGMGAVLFILFIVGFSILFFGGNKESDLSETVRQETKARIEHTEPVTVAETELATEEMISPISKTAGENAAGASLSIQDEEENTLTEYDSENSINMGDIADDMNGQMNDALTALVGTCLNIFNIIGSILMIWAIGQLIMAFKNEDADGKGRALMIMVTSTLLISIPTIFHALLMV